MKKNSELENLKIQTRRKEKIKKELVDKKWIFKIIIITFTLSLGLSFLSESTVPKLNLIGGIFIALIFVILGIAFDIIGVSVTTASSKVFHSMNSRKVKGANIAVNFKRNSEKVSSFCCDVVGDICGVISGSTSVIIAGSLSKKLGIDLFLMTLLVTAAVASLTIGGKAIGKSFAINKCDIILYEFSKLITFFYRCK
ncbi:MAG: hypothetical protein HFJ12_01235 [Bacilli bacterium]|nr:hypothetical protein [Bacilli bacterium]